MIDRSHEIAAAAFRPFSSLRGAGRVARLINTACLAAGSSPLKTAELEDGSRLILDLRSQTQWYSFYSGRYSEYFINLLKTLLRRGGNLIDVGANIGFFTIQIANSIHDNQRVFSFEPVAANFERLSQNIERNDLQAKVQAFQFGLSDQYTAATITLREDFLGGATTGNAALSISPEADADFETMQVQLRPLDSLLDELDLGDVQAIKLDIEGHEDLFFSGAKKFFKSHQPVVLCEINKPYYRWRCVDLNDTFWNVMPDDYSIYRVNQPGIKKIVNLNCLREIEDVLLCPKSNESLLNDITGH